MSTIHRWSYLDPNISTRDNLEALHWRTRDWPCASREYGDPQRSDTVDWSERAADQGETSCISEELAYGGGFSSARRICSFSCSPWASKRAYSYENERFERAARFQPRTVPLWLPRDSSPRLVWWILREHCRCPELEECRSIPYCNRHILFECHTSKSSLKNFSAQWRRSYRAENGAKWVFHLGYVS